jgi:hypothetical protein
VSASPLSRDGEDKPTHTIVRLPEGVAPPRIDGVFDDEAWQLVTPLDELTQAIPIELSAPSQRTEIRLAYDSRAFYMAVTCYDDSASGVRATLSERDAVLNDEDRIVFIFDTNLDGVSAFGFQVGAGGARSDAAVYKGKIPNLNVDYDWTASTHVTGEGWVTEVEIPWFNFTFDRDQDVWGFNIQRAITHEGEVVRWSSPVSRAEAFAPAYAGRLEGLVGMNRGTDLDVKPFVVGRYDRDRGVGDEDLDFDAGLDLVYGLSSTTVFKLSLNTDFAETEVDGRYVNLTRYSLFYPEKRDFFSEDAGLFAFGEPIRGGSQDVIPYHSRVIGLDARREEVPILAASKLTAEGKGYSYGLLAVRTKEKDMLDEQTLLVGRFSKTFGEASDVGILITDGDPLDRDREHTIGADLNFRTTEFLDDKNLNVTAFLLTSEKERASDEQNSYELFIDYPNDEVEAFAAYTVVEENFDPALGFVPRKGIKKYQGDFAYRPRIDTAVRQLDFSVETDVITDMGGDKETVDIMLRPFGIHFDSGDNAGVDVEYREEELSRPFTIVPGVRVPVGGYEFLRYGLRVNSSTQRSMWASVSAFFGEFFGGEREDYGASVTWRPGRGERLVTGRLTAELEHTEIGLPSGAFDVDVIRVRGNVEVGDYLYWNNYLQWDDQTDLLGLNSRLRWIIEDGRELNFVVNQGWIYDTETFYSDESTVTFKFSYNFHF